jgi:hypothetical protein
MTEPMHPKRFWDLLGCAADWDDPEERFEDIEDRLGSLPEEEILAFYVRYDRCIEDAWREDLAQAGFLTVYRGSGRFGSEDFLGFACWLIDQGWPVYRAALADPDSLADVEEEPPWDSDGLWLAAENAWEMKTARTAEEFHRLLEDSVSEGQEFPADGTGDEDELRRRLPRLAARFLGE